ncbi:hypothetical protein UFOVP58_58 [uncultured Caudovirales phage]|uniref:EF-hand domain-containing protein n=1 Tax=uncultured Caudovirales phage TaxID=2100421 RepID=A0A6J5KRL4_9CAUD|nr:hypothetical protein UFOVP58_58 [uncultured Caudovirales phage]
MKSFVDFNKEVLEEGHGKNDAMILRLFTGGKSPEKIATQLNIDVDNVKDYIQNRMPQSDQSDRSRGYNSGRNVSQGMKENATMTDTIDEKLVGKQKKLDVNKNGKLDAEDFKKLRKEETDLEEAKCKEDAPFEGGVASKGNVKDKSGAVHTPMSRARHAAKEAMKQFSKTKKEERDSSGRMVEDVELDEWKVESDWKKSDPEDKRSGQEKVKALSAKAATPSKLKPKKAFEEVEGLDELSKTTLGSYVKKAAADSTISRKVASDFEHMASRAKKPSMKASASELEKEYKSKSWKRRDNIGKAVDRLTKEEVELDEEINIFCEEMISHSDFHDKIAMHKKAGNNVVDYDHTEKKAHITTIDKEGMKRKVVYTPKGVSMQNMGQHQGDDKDETGEKIKKADTTGEKRGRGRPAGSKSGANLANAPAKRDFRGVSTHSLNISSNRSMREEVELEEAIEYLKVANKHLKDSMSKGVTAIQKAHAIKMHKRAIEASKMDDEVSARKHYTGYTPVNEEAEMSPEMKTKQERIVKGMKKSYSSFVSKYGDKAKNVMYATATKMAMKEETDQMEITHRSGRKETAKVHMTGSDYHIVKNKAGTQYTVDKKGNVRQGGNVNEETELDEAVQTGNPGLGYHGEHEPEVADKKYSKAHASVKKIAGEAGHLKDAKKPNELVKSYLDSKRGRHLAGNETDHEYIKRDFGQFKNSQ